MSATTANQVLVTPPQNVTVCHHDDGTESFAEAVAFVVTADATDQRYWLATEAVAQLAISHAQSAWGDEGYDTAWSIDRERGVSYQDTREYVDTAGRWQTLPRRAEDWHSCGRTPEGLYRLPRRDFRPPDDPDTSSRRITRLYDATGREVASDPYGDRDVPAITAQAV